MRMTEAETAGFDVAACHLDVLGDVLLLLVTFYRGRCNALRVVLLARRKSDRREDKT